MQPTKFYLVVNLKIAKAFGLMIPEFFLLRAPQWKMALSCLGDLNRVHFQEGRAHSGTLPTMTALEAMP